MLHLLLGIYVVVATDAAIPLAWFKFVLFSFSGAVLLLLCRIIFFILNLLTNAIMCSWARWIQLGFIFVTLIIIFATNLDIAFKISLSESAIREEIQYIQLVHERDKQKIEWQTKPIGFFNMHLEEYEAQGKVVWFHTVDGSNVFGPKSVYGGIVYSENGVPPNKGESTYQHLYGPWWRWLQDM